MSEIDDQLKALGAVEDTEGSNPSSDIHPDLKALGAEPEFSGTIPGEQDVPLDSAGLIGAQQMLTGSFADELGGAMGAGFEGVANAIKEKSLKPISNTNLKKLYNEYVQMQRDIVHKAEKQSPIAYTSGGLASGFLMPTGILGKVGKLGEAATFGDKIIKGIGVGGALGGINAAGSTEKSLTSKEGLNDIATGAGYGAALGGAIPAAIGTTKAIGSGIKGLASPIIKGFKQGLKGVNLVGDEAEKTIQSKIAQYGKGLSKNIIDELNQLGKTKNDLVKEAQDAGVKIDPNKVEEMIAKRLGDDPATNLPEVHREIEQFREMLRTAKEGPMVEKSQRVFFGDKPTQLEQFRRQGNAKNQVEAINAVKPQVPSDVNDFDQLLQMKQREQKMVPGMNQNPMEVVHMPTENPGELHKVIRQPRSIPEEGQATEYNKIASKVLQTEAPKSPQPYEMILQPTDDPNQVLGIIRRPIHDAKGNITSYKNIQSKLMPKEEAAKFKDITTLERAGGKDLSQPEQMLQFYKDLKAKSSYGDYSFKSKEAQRAASETMNEARDLLRSKVDNKPIIPGLEDTDKKISSLKQGAQLIGLENTTDGVDPQKLMNKIIDLVNTQENVGGSGGKSRQKLEDFIGAIKEQHPEMAARVQQEIQDLGEQAIASKNITGLSDPAKISSVKRMAVAGGNVVGRGINNITSLPPEALKQKVLQLSQMGSKAASEVARVLGTLPNKTERERNAVLFGLMQNPAYRKFIIDKDEEEVK